jgi:hypothetical protein
MARHLGFPHGGVVGSWVITPVDSNSNLNVQLGPMGFRVLGFKEG